MRRVRVCFLGGTISMTRVSARTPHVAPSLTGSDLLAGLTLPEGVRAEPDDVARTDSSALGVGLCLETLARADMAVRLGEADAVVVVQGTDTLEETAYLWDLLWPHPQPFVVTGAMRAPDTPGADGPANLLAAITVASDDQARDQGVLVVLGDEVHAARHVSKRHTTSPSAFASPGLGPVGWLQEGRAVLAARLPRREVLPTPVRVPGVGLVRASLDDDPRLYRAAAEVSEALVVEGFGAGQVTPGAAQVLAEVAASRPVVIASRTGAGPVAVQTYTGQGSGSDLLARGVVGSGRLGGLRSRLLLMVLLGGSRPPTAAEVAAAFARHGGA